MQIEDNKVENIFTINPLRMLKIFGSGVIVSGVTALFKKKTATES